MSLKARKELLASVAPRYHAANKSEKERILDEFVASTGYHRKYAIALMNKTMNTGSVEATPPTRLPRKKHYSSEVQQVLVTIWEAAGRICSKRLVPFLPELIRVLERYGYLSLSDQIRAQVLSISPATVDRLLAKTRQADKMRGRTTTLPGSLLKHHVPLRTFSDWDDLQLGFIEADLVAHCGSSVEGSYLHSLVMTDVSTGWTECMALLYRDQDTVLRGLRLGRERLPFPLLGLDTDNGTEFLNYMLLDYCQKEEITFTRSRAYKKNDQCHVEEKNGSIVRRFVGYDRFEGIEACRALAELYETNRLYVNFFQPSMKLISKERQGSKVVKKYDEAKTPCQRILASSEVSDAAKEKLRRQFNGLDPTKLLARLEQLQDRLWTYAHAPARTIDGSDNRAETDSPASSFSLVVSSQALAQEPSIAVGDGACQSVSVRVASGEGTKPSPPSRSERQYRKSKRNGRYHLVKHTWRTKPDPFASVWHEVEAELKKTPHQEAKSLFRGLQERYPGQFKDGQLRTLQRRVKAWRLRQASFVAEKIGLVLAEETIDDHSTSVLDETVPGLAVNRFTLVYTNRDHILRSGGLCTGEQVCDWSTSAQRYCEEMCQRLTLGYIVFTGIPRWSA